MVDGVEAVVAFSFCGWSQRCSSGVRVRRGTQNAVHRDGRRSVATHSRFSFDVVCRDAGDADLKTNSDYNASACHTKDNTPSRSNVDDTRNRSEENIGSQSPSWTVIWFLRRKNVVKIGIAVICAKQSLLQMGWCIDHVKKRPLNIRSPSTLLHRFSSFDAIQNLVYESARRDVV